MNAKNVDKTNIANNVMFIFVEIVSKKYIKIVILYIMMTYTQKLNKKLITL